MIERLTSCSMIYAFIYLKEDTPVKMKMSTKKKTNSNIFVTISIKDQQICKMLFFLTS